MSGLSCAQTPPRFSDTVDTKSIKSRDNLFGNAGLRLSALVAGTGLLSNPGTSGGIGVDENIQTTLTHNGVPYTFNEMRFYDGAHQIFKKSDIGDQCSTRCTGAGIYVTAPLEAYIFFKNTSNKTICLVLPIGIDDTKTGKGGAVTTNASIYINTLTTTAGTTPSLLTQLFQDLSGKIPTFSFTAKNSILTYDGQDVRLLSSCSTTSTAYPVTYFVIMNDPTTNLLNSTITSNELDELIKKVKNPNPIMSLSKITNTINTALVTVSVFHMYPSEMFTISVAGSSGTRTISTSALKCYPINPTKNIRDNQLTLDKDGVPVTLADELNQNAPSQGASAVNLQFDGWLSPAGIEAMIAIIITGLVIGISIGMYMYYMRKSSAPPAAAAAAMAATATTVAAAGPIATTASSTLSTIGAWFRANGMFWIIFMLVATIIGLICFTLFFAFK